MSMYMLHITLRMESNDTMCRNGETDPIKKTELSTMNQIIRVKGDNWIKRIPHNMNNMMLAIH